MSEKSKYQYIPEWRGPDTKGVICSWRKGKLYKSAGAAKNYIKAFKKYPGVEVKVTPVLMSTWLGEETCDKDLSV